MQTVPILAASIVFKIFPLFFTALSIRALALQILADPRFGLGLPAEQR